MLRECKAGGILFLVFVFVQAVMMLVNMDILSQRAPRKPRTPHQRYLKRRIMVPSTPSAPSKPLRKPGELRAATQPTARAPGAVDVPTHISVPVTNTLSASRNSTAEERMMEVVHNAIHIVIVIPYRDRKEHYQKIVQNIQRMRRSYWKLHVIVVEQTSVGYFRRGWLLNIGIAEARKRFADDNVCLVTHDVDMIADSKVDYGWCDRPTQICSELSCFNDGVPYLTYGGGVVQASFEDWYAVNGFTNNAHGWGGEDDDLYHRFRINNLLTKKGHLRRPLKGFGKCHCMNDKNHTKRERHPEEYKNIVQQITRMKKGSKEWQSDGLNTLTYNVVENYSDTFGTHWLKVSDKLLSTPTKFSVHILTTGKWDISQLLDVLPQAQVFQGSVGYDASCKRILREKKVRFAKTYYGTVDSIEEGKLGHWCSHLRFAAQCVGVCVLIEDNAVLSSADVTALHDAVQQGWDTTILQLGISGDVINAWNGSRTNVLFEAVQQSGIDNPSDLFYDSLHMFTKRGPIGTIKDPSNSAKISLIRSMPRLLKLADLNAELSTSVATQPKRTWLVFTSAGDRSNVAQWYREDKEFDLMVVYYGDKAEYEYATLADRLEVRKDGKFPNLLHFYDSIPAQYTSIFVLDDDIDMSSDAISALFRFQEEHNVGIASPTFKPYHRGYNSLVPVDGSVIRYVDFVEMNTPMFQRGVLDKFMKVFDPVLKGWGADIWFAHLCNEDDACNLAVADEIHAHNPLARANGKREIEALQPESERAKTWRAVAKKHNIPDSTGHATIPGFNLLNMGSTVNEPMKDKDIIQWPRKDSDIEPVEPITDHSNWAFVCITGQLQRLELRSKLERIIAPLAARYPDVVVGLALSVADAHYTNPDKDDAHEQMPYPYTMDTARHMLTSAGATRVHVLTPVHNDSVPINQQIFDQYDKKDRGKAFLLHRAKNHIRQYEALAACEEGLKLHSTAPDVVFRARDDAYVVSADMDALIAQTRVQQGTTLLSMQCASWGGINDNFAVLSGWAQNRKGSQYFTAPLQLYHRSNIPRDVINPETYYADTYKRIGLHMQTTADMTVLTARLNVHEGCWRFMPRAVADCASSTRTRIMRDVEAGDTNLPCVPVQTQSESANTVPTMFFGGGMTTDERAFLRDVYTDTTSIFEWGMGASSVLASEMQIPMLVSVDNAKDWVHKTSSTVNNKNYAFYWVDTGEIGKWGKPTQPPTQQWLQYSKKVYDEPNAFDVYLVDGRFRVACACAALLHASDESFVMIHDFDREYYHVILEVSDKIKQVGKLVQLKRRSSDDSRVKALWEKYKYDFK